MAFSDYLDKFFLGNPERIQEIQRFKPEQQDLIGRLGQIGLNQIENPQAGFEPIANEARRNFNQTTVPSIAERFTQMGGQRSSAFGQHLGSQVAGLESMLAALGAQFGQRQQQLGQNLAQMGLTQQFDPVLRPGTPGILEFLGGPLAQLFLSPTGRSSGQSMMGQGEMIGSLLKFLPLLLG